MDHTARALESIAASLQEDRKLKREEVEELRTLNLILFARFEDDIPGGYIGEIKRRLV